MIPVTCHQMGNQSWGPKADEVHKAYIHTCLSPFLLAALGWQTHEGFTNIVLSHSTSAGVWWTKDESDKALFPSIGLNLNQLNLLNIYTTVQKFGVTQTISWFPWELTKFVAKWIVYIVKTLTRLEIIIFIWNNNFVLQTLLSSNNFPFAAITALQTFGILAVNLLR